MAYITEELLKRLGIDRQREEDQPIGEGLVPTPAPNIPIDTQPPLPPTQEPITPDPNLINRLIEGGSGRLRGGGMLPQPAPIDAPSLPDFLTKPRIPEEPSILMGGDEKRIEELKAQAPDINLPTPEYTGEQPSLLWKSDEEIEKLKAQAPDIPTPEYTGEGEMPRLLWSDERIKQAMEGEEAAPEAPEDTRSLFDRIREATQMKQIAGELGDAPATQEKPKRKPAAETKVKTPTEEEEAAERGIEIVPEAPEGRDEEMQAALDYQKRMREEGTMQKAASRLGAAIAGLGPKAVLKPSTEGADDLIKMGEARVKDLLTKRKGEADLYDLNDKRAMADPNSPISKALREGAANFGINMPENVSGTQLDATGLNLGSLLTAKMHAEARKDAAEARKQQSIENRELRREQFEYRKSKDIQRASERFSQYLEADPEMKQIKKEKLALGQVEKLIELSKGGNTVAAAGLGAKTARAMGEVGVLTEEDVARYVRSGALARGAADKLMKWIKGKPTDATLEEVRQISLAIKASFEEKIQPMYDKYANRLSRIYNIPLEEAYYVMDARMPSPAPGVPAADTVKVKDPKGKIRLIPKNRLQDALNAGGELVE